MIKFNGVMQKEGIFEMCGEWYFSTREGIEGPYQSQLQAKKKQKVYLGIFGNLDLADRRTPVSPAISTPNHSLFPAHMQWR